MKKKRPSKLCANNSCTYQHLEPRQLLASITVNTNSDIASPIADGQLSLREAIIAANTNAAYGDAPAGDAGRDIIQAVDGLESIQLFGGQFEITESLTITNFTVDAGGNSRVFHLENAGSFRIQAMEIEGGQAQSGGTIHSINTNLFLKDVYISESTATDGNGGAIDMSGGILEIKFSSIKDNHATGYGGSIHANSAQLEFASTQLQGSADKSGGALDLYNSQIAYSGDPLLGHSRVKGIANRNGGAISLRNGSEARLHNLERLTGTAGLVDSEIHGLGGALYSSGSSTTITGFSSIWGHAYHAGGGIAIAGGSLELNSGATINPRNPILSSNDIDLNGISGIILNSEDGTAPGLKAGGSIFSTNANVQVSGFQIKGQQEQLGMVRGGGAYFGGSDVQIDNSFFEQNKARFGGAIFVANGTNLDLGKSSIRLPSAWKGGGIFATQGTSTNVDNIAILRAHAYSDGGGIENHGQLSVANSIFIGNTAETRLHDLEFTSDARYRAGNGGAIHNTGELNVANSTMYWGFAKRGGGIAGSGTIRVSDSKLYYNTAANQRTIFYRDGEGGAIQSDGDLLELNNVQIMGNLGAFGGGVSFSGDTLEVRDSFFGPKTRASGSNIYISENQNFRDGYRNTHGDGGALRITGDVNASITNSRFFNNVGATFGGAIAIVADETGAPSVSIEDSRFDGNTVIETLSNQDVSVLKGGGAIANIGGALDIRSSQFLNNSATGWGGAIATQGGSLVTNHLTFLNNAADTGGAISTRAGTNWKEEHSSFSGNTASEGGGAIFSAASIVSLTRAVFTSNGAGDTDFLENDDESLERFTPTEHSANGGAILIDSGMFSSTNIFLEDSRASGFGGAVAIENGTNFNDLGSRFTKSYAGLGGGGIANLGASFALRNARISENWTSSLEGGGGMYLSSELATEISEGTSIEGNRASRSHGGGIFAKESGLSINQTHVSGNEAARNGGAVYLRDGELTSNEGNFGANTAMQNGGGLFLKNASTQFTRLSTYDNVAGRNDLIEHGLGGSIFASNSQVEVKGPFGIGGSAYHAGGAIAILGGSLTMDSESENPFLEDLFTHHFSGMLSGKILPSQEGSATGPKVGGAIYAKGSVVNLRALNLNAFDSYAKRGGGIFVTTGTQLEILQSRISSAAQFSGGAIFTSKGSITRIDESLITSSFANLGAGIANHGDLEVLATTFEGNDAQIREGGSTPMGGAIFNTGLLESHGVYFHSNDAVRGGAIAGRGTMDISGSNFESNHAEDYRDNMRSSFGGAIFSNGDLLNLTGVNFTFNSAINGGAIAFSGTSLIGNDIEFRDNHAIDRIRREQPGWGGALHLSGNSESSFSETNFENNSATVRGGAVAVVANQVGTPLVTFDASSFANNHVAADERSDTPLPVFGAGAIINQGGILEVRDAIFSENSSNGRGGAIANLAGATTTFRQVEIRNSYAKTVGGAIFNDAELFLYDSLIAENHAEILSGGIFESSNSQTTLVRTELVDNSE